MGRQNSNVSMKVVLQSFSQAVDLECTLTVFTSRICEGAHWRQLFNRNADDLNSQCLEQSLVIVATLRSIYHFQPIQINVNV